MLRTQEITVTFIILILGKSVEKSAKLVLWKCANFRIINVSRLATFTNYKYKPLIVELLLACEILVAGGHPSRSSYQRSRPSSWSIGDYYKNKFKSTVPGGFDLVDDDFSIFAYICKTNKVNTDEIVLATLTRYYYWVTTN